MIDMTADAQRNVDLLRLEPGDLPAQQVERASSSARGMPSSSSSPS